MNNIEYSKLIRMIAVIGIICLAVGIATRVYQKNQKYLSPGGSTTESNIDSSKDDSSDSSSESTGDNSNVTQEEYDAFYYVDNEDGSSSLHILYYNDSHSLVNGEMNCSGSIAEDLLHIFFKLYKKEYELTFVSTFDSKADDVATLLSKNITFCDGNILYINPSTEKNEKDEAYIILSEYGFSLLESDEANSCSSAFMK